MPLLPGDFYHDVPQSNVAIARFQKDMNFIAPFFAAKLIVNKPSGLVTKWDMADLNRDEMEERDATAPAKSKDFKQSKVAFDTQIRSIAYDLNDTTRKASDVETDPAKMIPRVLAYKALIKLERLVATQIFKTGVWFRQVNGDPADAGPPVPEGAGPTTRKRWSDTTTNPIKAIDEEKEYQGKLTGFEPNAMVFGRRLWTAVRNHPEVRAALTSGTVAVVRNRPASLEEMAALLELEWVGVSKAIHNTSAEGEVATNARILDEKAALLYWRPGGSATDAGVYNNEEPCAVARLVWRDGAGSDEGIRIRTFRDEKAGAGGSDHSELDLFNDFKVLTAEMGTFFNDMTL